MKQLKTDPLSVVQSDGKIGAIPKIVEKDFELLMVKDTRFQALVNCC